MKMSVSPTPARNSPPSAADSSARKLVVPTATTRPPRWHVRATASTVSAPTSYHSLCIRCSDRFSVRTGWKVPAPTCSVTRACSTPRAVSASSRA